MGQLWWQEWANNPVSSWPRSRDPTKMHSGQVTNNRKPVRWCAAYSLWPRRSLTASHSGRRRSSQDDFVTVAVNGTSALALPGTRDTCNQLQDASNSKKEKAIETHRAPDTVPVKSGPRPEIIASQPSSKQLVIAVVVINQNKIHTAARH